jgi:hypothetical protein
MGWRRDDPSISIPMITIATTTDTLENVEAALAAKPKPTTPDQAPPVKEPEAPAAAPDAKPEAPAAEKPATEEDKAKAASEAGKALAARKSKLQDRIDTLVREKHTSARERDEARRELDKMRRELEAIKGGATKPAADTAKVEATSEPAATVSAERPKQGENEDYDVYMERLADWKAEQKINAVLAARDKAAADAKAKADAEAEEAKAKAAVEAATKSRQDRLAKARESHADWDQVIEAAKGFPFTDLMSIHVGESELGGELLYYLATHEADCREIAELSKTSPAQALVKLGRLEARIEASSVIGDALEDDSTTETTQPEATTPAVAPEVAARPVSKAPVMVSRVSGGGGVTAHKDLYSKDLTYAEHKALMAQRERARRGL